MIIYATLSTGPAMG